ncbi:phosphotransferase [Burkholderia metallica]|uniref:phosphotransferase n=1 Tax=Burkholderia metallica TaxID=488729 RepID=UPI001CF47C29|nr:phosphotransferase [Burkholderia metallica]MCA7998061.1 phosphotransferase [Burkholderia metallica]
MIIINSGGYVTAEFQVEFGKIPPCMLPIGNKKLIEHQVQRLRTAFPEREIILTLPETFRPAINERALLNSLEIDCVTIPEKFKLVDSLLFVLNSSDTTSDSVALLHGDTLINEFPGDADVIGVAETNDDYAWETESVEDGTELVWCGYFSFSNIRSFVKSLALSKGDFVHAVRSYAQLHELPRRTIGDWHDLGHVNTYFKSRAGITTQRSFNSLDICSGTLTKRGKPSIKIKAEARWFANLPVALRRFVPQLIDAGTDAQGETYYTLEYLPMTPLNEIFVHGHNPVFFWARIVKLLEGYFKVARECRCPEVLHQGIEDDARMLYREKTRVRLAEYSKSRDVPLDVPVQYGALVLPSVNEIADQCIELACASTCEIAVGHGDLCFSNILFDSRGDNIKVIDPRGLNQSHELTIYGDQKYDLSKLCHSVLGLYDFIIAGRYRLAQEIGGCTIEFDLDDRLKSIQHLFENAKFIPGVSFANVIPHTILLFLSMLPLHGDQPQRQQALFVNALRLYSQYFATSSETSLDRHPHGRVEQPIL